MSKQLGGLKLKHPSKAGFKALYDMINSTSGRINLLTFCETVLINWGGKHQRLFGCGTNSTFQILI